MITRLAVGIMLAAVVFACSGAPAGTPAPGATATPGPAATPGVVITPGTPTNPPGGPPVGGNSEARVRALVPPGSTEVQEVEAGDFYSLSVTSNLTVDQLEAHFDQAIPAQALTISGKFKSAGTLTIAITNPDGGVLVTPNDSGGSLVIISLGISS